MRISVRIMRREGARGNDRENLIRGIKAARRGAYLSRHKLDRGFGIRILAKLVSEANNIFGSRHYLQHPICRQRAGERAEQERNDGEYSSRALEREADARRRNRQGHVERKAEHDERGVPRSARPTVPIGEPARYSRRQEGKN